MSCVALIGEATARSLIGGQTVVVLALDDDCRRFARAYYRFYSLARKKSGDGGVGVGARGDWRNTAQSKGATIGAASFPSFHHSRLHASPPTHFDIALSQLTFSRHYASAPNTSAPNVPPTSPRDTGTMS